MLGQAQCAARDHPRSPARATTRAAPAAAARDGVTARVTVYRPHYYSDRTAAQVLRIPVQDTTPRRQRSIVRNCSLVVDRSLRFRLGPASPRPAGLLNGRRAVPPIRYLSYLLLAYTETKFRGGPSTRRLEGSRGSTPRPRAAGDGPRGAGPGAGWSGSGEAAPQTRIMSFRGTAAEMLGRPTLGLRSTAQRARNITHHSSV